MDTYVTCVTRKVHLYTFRPRPSSLTSAPHCAGPLQVIVKMLTEGERVYRQLVTDDRLKFLTRVGAPYRGIVDTEGKLLGMLPGTEGSDVQK